MAKKGQAVQLQTEVNNDEEWDKLLQRDGLIVVDIYSEWCGPCSGMAATLKKLKLEIGGDLLQLAIAKSDKINILERFRNKSEPTWMFIVNGKMVNFMFGANAPKLTRLITEELKKETDARQGRRDRVQQEISDLTEEEKERLDVQEGIAREAREREMQKAAKELYDRRMAEAQNILENLNHFGIILIFPHARTIYMEAFGDLLGEAGLTINQTEKLTLTQEQIEELFFFGTIPFPQESIEQLLTGQSIILLVKPIPARDVTEPTDDLLQQIVYGNMRKPPGALDSPARVLAKVPQESPEGEQLEPLEMIGVWVPENDKIKATGLRLLFNRYTEHYLIPEPEPIPPHYAVAFEADRRHEVQDLMDKYANEILRYGFFSSEVPEEATLIAKTIRKYERTPAKDPNQRMVIQLAKRQSECVLAFAQIKPYYMSPNPKEGDRECKIFFPDGYDEPPEEEEPEPEPTPVRPPRKRRRSSQTSKLSATGSAAPSDIETVVEESAVREEGEPPEGATVEGAPIPTEGAEIPPSEQAAEIPPGMEAPAPPSELPPQEATPVVEAPPSAEPAPATEVPATEVPATEAPATVETSADAPAQPPADAPVEEAPTTEESPEVTEPPTDSAPTTEPTTDVTETTDEESPA